MVIQKLRDLFRIDAFDPSVDVFPNLDVATLARQTRAEELGRNRGKKDQPAADAIDPDATELAIIERVREHRDLGLKSYQERATVYFERLNRTTEALTEIRQAASKASAEFESECRGAEGYMQGPMIRLEDCVRWNHAFRRRHRIESPGTHLYSGGFKWLAICMLLVLIESLLNAYLFAQKNELGLLGGVIAASLISITNVGAASAAGYYSRFINHVRLFAKLYGLMIILSWLAFVGVFNVGVAHFRDALVGSEDADWQAAAVMAIDSLKSSPLGIIHFESWLLVVIGVLISLGGMLKGFYADDPYPGYGRVARELEAARSHYADEHDETLRGLKETHDRIAEPLEAAGEEIHGTVAEAIDAFFGQTSLQNQLRSFLDSCDSTAQLLVKMYRDANAEERSAPAPGHFGTPFRFPAHQEFDISGIDRDRSQGERDKASVIIEEAVQELEQIYKVSIRNFRSVREVEQDVIAKLEESRTTDG